MLKMLCIKKYMILLIIIILIPLKKFNKYAILKEEDEIVRSIFLRKITTILIIKFYELCL